MALQSDEARKRHELMTKITVKAWTDPSFKKKLLSDPKGTLAAEGLSMPKNMKANIVFHEDDENTRNFVIPAPPQALSLSEKDLNVLAAQRLSIQLELF